MVVRGFALSALVSVCALALSGCTFGGGTTTVTDGQSCTRVTVPRVDVSAPTAPTTLPGVVLAPCPTSTTPAPPPTTVPPTTVPATTPPPTTTKPVPTTVPPTTTSAPPPASSSAATRYGWGTPIAALSDEFNGTTLDTSKWGAPEGCWPANDTVKAGRCGDHNTVGNGYLRETGTPDGKTGYVSARTGRKYGRYEVRMRVVTAAPGKAFHPVLLLWPDSEQWPSGGEYDYAETDSNADHTEAFMHHPSGSQDAYSSAPLDLSQWHNYAFEWTATSLTGWIDGVQWFHDTAASAQAPGPMHTTIQLDDFEGTSGMATVHMDVDWLRAYPAA